jgi:hypothetical protein
MYLYLWGCHFDSYLWNNHGVLLIMSRPVKTVSFIEGTGYLPISVLFGLYRCDWNLIKINRLNSECFVQNKDFCFPEYLWKIISFKQEFFLDALSSTKLLMFLPSPCGAGLSCLHHIFRTSGKMRYINGRRKVSRILAACWLFQNTFLLSPTSFTSLHRTASATDILELFIVQRHREELE